MRWDFNCLWRRQQTFQGNLTPSLTVPALFENKAFTKGRNKFQLEEMFAHLYFIVKKEWSTKWESVHKILATWWISNCLWRQLTFPVLWTDTTQRQLRLDHCDWLSRNLLSSPLFICKIYDYNLYNWYKVYCDWLSRNMLGSSLFICNAMPWSLTMFLLLLFNILVLLPPWV